MLTGDAVAIAIETCKQLALGTHVYDSERLITGGMAGSEVRSLSSVRFTTTSDPNLCAGPRLHRERRRFRRSRSRTRTFRSLTTHRRCADQLDSQKYQVVEMLQNRGHLTAMTGDGVNDAPSLKRADCGIAVEGASDAARSAADVVFLDEGLSTIITSIKVARQIFHRMKGKLINPF